MACGSVPPGASDANLAQAKNRASRGALAFEQQCQSCHGSRGEGGTKAPTIIGGGALPVYPRTAAVNNLTTDPNQLQLQTQSRVPGAQARQPFKTAADLFDYVSTRMPPTRPGSLPKDEYWSIVTFMLVAHGADVRNEGITPQNASSVAIQPK